jgi:hypothetical protein
MVVDFSVRRTLLDGSQAEPAISAVCAGTRRSGTTATSAVTTGALRFDEGETDRLGLGDTDGETVVVVDVGSTVPVGTGETVDVADPREMSALSLALPCVPPHAWCAVHGQNPAESVKSSTATRLHLKELDPERRIPPEPLVLLASGRSSQRCAIT